MAYQNFRYGFNIQTDSAVDKRLVLTKAQMLDVDSLFAMPNQYFTICADDGNLYVYNVNNTFDPQIGKFRLLEAVSTTAWGQITGTLEDQLDLVATLNDKQDLLTNGTGIDITNNIISLDLSQVVLDGGMAADWA